MKNLTQILVSCALFLVFFNFIPHQLPGTGNGESLFIQQAFDSQHAFHILTPVHPLPGAALHGLQLRKLRLPKPQHISRQLAQLRHFSDAEVKFLRNQYISRFSFGAARLGAHSVICVFSTMRRHTQLKINCRPYTVPGWRRGYRRLTT